MLFFNPQKWATLVMIFGSSTVASPCLAVPTFTYPLASSYPSPLAFPYTSPLFSTYPSNLSSPNPAHLSPSLGEVIRGKCYMGGVWWVRYELLLVGTRIFSSAILFRQRIINITSWLLFPLPSLFPFLPLSLTSSLFFPFPHLFPFLPLS